ncbi:MAG: peptidoglycan DD-metalloendopeptidase family protein [Planktothrix rubescens PR222]
MKGTVPNHDQPVVMPNLDFNLDQTATGQTKQKAVYSGSHKVYTSVAFLGLAIASGVLMPKANDRAMATELSNSESSPTMQSPGPMAASSPVGENSTAARQAAKSDWQPSLLRTISGLNTDENAVNNQSHSQDLGLEKPEKTSVEAFSTPDSRSSVTSESLPESATLTESQTEFNQQILPSSRVETEPSVQISPSPTNSNQQGDQTNRASTSVDSNSLDTLSQEMSGAFVIPNDERDQTVSEVYQVGSGDTLARIAKAHNVSVDTIIKANQLTDPNALSVNQSLKIPKQLASSFSNSPASLATNSWQDPQIRPDADPSPQQASAATDLRLLRGRLPQAVLPAVLPSEYRSDDSAVADLPGEDIADLSSIPTHSTLNQISLNQLANRAMNDGVDASTPIATAAVAIPVDSKFSSLSEQLAVQEVSVSKSEAVNKLYSDRLRSEVERLREEYKVQSGYQLTSVSLEPNEQPKAEVLTSKGMASLHRQKLINPEFNPQAYAPEKASQAEQNLASEQLAQLSPNGVTSPAAQLQPASRRSVVATAPVGSRAYDPLSNPALGQMVSPQLPPLSGPDVYLPSGSMRFNGYIWPSSGVLSSGYGWRWGRMHRGIDIAGPIGTPVVAAAPGVVSYAGWNDGGYGNLVEIEHPDGSLTVYAHNDRILVSEGQKVAQGDQISEMGTTGRSTGPHLHFEVHPSGQGAVNPMAVLPPESSTVSQNY